MSKQTQAIRADLDTLAEDARALVGATADRAGEKISEARQRAAAAMEKGKDMYARVHDKTVKGLGAADEALHAHPYQVLGVALGVGALVGYLIVRYCVHHGASRLKPETLDPETQSRRRQALRATSAGHEQDSTE